MKHSSQYAFDYAVLDQEMGGNLASLFYIFQNFGTKEIKRALEEKRLIGERYYDSRTKCGCFIGVNIKDYNQAHIWAMDHKPARAAEIWLIVEKNRDLGLVAKAIQLWETRPKAADSAGAE